MTPRQALNIYNSNYDNDAYGAVTDELVFILGAGSDLSDEALRDTPDYITLSNMITNVALQICGYPAYAGEGWQLATSLHAVTHPRIASGDLDPEAVQKFFGLLDGYFGIYRHAVKTHRESLNADDHAQATSEVESVWRLAEDAVRTTSNVREWNGRCAYHLVSAAEGFLRTAMLMLAQKPDETSPSRFGYAAEKFGRALRDLSYALEEIQPQVNTKSFFVTAHEILRKLSEEV